MEEIVIQIGTVSPQYNYAINGETFSQIFISTPILIELVKYFQLIKLNFVIVAVNNEHTFYRNTELKKDILCCVVLGLFHRATQFVRLEGTVRVVTGQRRDGHLQSTQIHVFTL